jgi:hypothetical protein
MANTRIAVVLVAVLATTGCSLATSVRRNTDAIAMSSSAIGTNTRAVTDSTTATGSLVPALEGVERLRGPMESVAALDPTGGGGLERADDRVAALDTSMRALADLQAPMTRLVGIAPGLDATAALGGPMMQLASMRPSLDAVAGLQGSLDRVAGLESQPASVAALQRSMQQLSTLREPLERVAELDAPMSRIAELGSLLDRPWLLLAAAVAALAAWGVVTYLAVRLAVLSAGRTPKATV